MGMDLKKILLAAGVSAAAIAVILYLKNQGQFAAGRSKKKVVEDYDVDDLHTLLRRIIESQEKTRKLMQDLAERINKTSMSLESTYYYVKQNQVEDPIKKAGLSMEDFDELLEIHRENGEVKNAVAQLMAPNSSGTQQDRVREVDVNKLIDVHKFMLQELKGIDKGFKSMNRADDTLARTMAAQAMVAAKISEKFGLTSADIDYLVIKHAESLQKNAEFGDINMEIQNIFQSTIMQ